MFNMFKKAAIVNRVEETILYEYVLDEIENVYKLGDYGQKPWLTLMEI